MQALRRLYAIIIIKFVPVWASSLAHSFSPTPTRPLSRCFGRSLVLKFYSPSAIRHGLLRSTGWQLFVEYRSVRAWNTVGIVTRGTASIGNVETLVESRQGVRVDDDDLDDIVEAVEAGLCMEPPRLSWGDTIVNYACSEGRTESEQTRCEDHEEELISHASSAEFLDALAARDDEAEADDGHRQEGQEGEICQCNGLSNVSLVDDGLLLRIDAINETDDEHDQAPNDGGDE